ncbi:hypothetical protein [Marinobacter orientalis]|uniref:Uncharacterized protein n=1 Tax=Marinobacter orientalis TaxID=1928859 RepID=A0A7Y0RC27_9GAMM|nr:hypothetical protein [Marinobacter orientalis]NMT63472.1 hypothetical protein [Marinobacter orientalis]TGX48533.1 hypothetical protein DIT72_14160 [Marinobacter orientalis]
MLNETPVKERKPTAAQLEEELWEQKLYDPEVFSNLVQRKKSLRLMTGRNVLLFSCIVGVTVILGIAVHWVFALAGVMVALIFLSKKRSQLASKRMEIDRLIGEPSALFNSIAVNKIMMEACSRSAEVERYLRAVNKHGRYKITQFENDKMVKILAALDRQ